MTSALGGSERLGNGAASHWNRSKRTRKWRRLTVGLEEHQAKPVFQRGGDEVDKMEDKLGRLGAARRAGLRQAKSGPLRLRENAANETGAKPLITKETAKRL